ncbi:MAG: SRPBCC family protein [Alphaproteobacteria bacterium]|nr:SRPBCC family protein [Alphaproteobacteria bacterium SS10]
MKITNVLAIDAPVESVWDVLGPNFVHAGDWASNVYASTPRPGKARVAAAPCAGRICETSMGPFNETIVGYDPSRYRLAYAATGAKMPGFMRSMVASWSLAPNNVNGTNVRMTLNADIAPPFNILMGWMMRMQFKKAIDESLEELKHFIETGEKHPRKLKVDGTKKAGLARQQAAAA